MRNKQLLFLPLFFIILTIASACSLYIPKSMVAGEDVLVIPNEAIRLRILANSNSDQDQEIKRKIRDKVNEQITEWVSSLTSLDEARAVIIENIPEIESIAKKVMQDEGITQNLEIEYGKVDFPTKLYGSFLYPAGKYEAILITIGEGVGANWWCVLFPPLCFLDFSSGSAVSDGFEDEHKTVQENKSSNTESKNKNTADYDLFIEDDDEVEVKFFVMEIFDKVVSIFN